MAILETKFRTPPIPAHLVSRQRLLKVLDSALERRLTLIIAPAGSGKTTLLSEWIAARSRHISAAWVSLGRQDNDPYHFWASFVSSVQLSLGKPFVDWAEVVGNPAASDIDGLINWLSSVARREIVLVLDDYHLVSSAQVADALTYLLDYLPSRTHLVLATRSVPALPIAQMRVRGQLAELTVHDLRFTLPEAEKFFDRVAQRRLSADEVAQVNERTEGWAAGLQTAALALQASGAIPFQELLAEFTGGHRFVDDYFLEQVLRGQPNDIQEFLLCTSILDRFHAPLCNAVTGRSDSQSILLRLVNNGLFLSSLDDGRAWYRYHHLFGDFLKRQLRAEHPQRYGDLQRKAAEWFAEHRLFEEAVEHALEAGDVHLADELIQQVESKIWGRHDVRTIHHWFSALPADFINARPDLCLSLAWRAEHVGDADEMLAYVKRMERCGRSVHDEIEAVPQEWYHSEQFYLAHGDILQGASLLWRGEVKKAAQIFRGALHRTPSDDSCRERALSLLYLATALFFTGELDDATTLYSQAAEISRNCHHHAAYVGAVSQLSAIRLLCGNMTEAEQYARDALEYVSSLETEVFAPDAHNCLAEISLQRNDIESAAKHAGEAARLAERGGGIQDSIAAKLTGARVAMASEDFITAQLCLQRAYQLALRQNLSVRAAEVMLWQVRLWLKTGTMEGVDRWLERLSAEAARVPYLQDAYQVLCARALLAKGRQAEAIPLLNALSDCAIEAKRNLAAIEALALLSIANSRLGSHAQAMGCLEQALRLAGPERLVRLFLDEGEQMKALILQLVRQSNKGHLLPPSVQVYADELLRWFESSAVHHPSHDLAVRKQQPLIEPLSERELQVLRVISSGKTYEQVAEALTIALSTVQWHVKNIYQKLGAHSGVEAGAIARQLGIL